MPTTFSKKIVQTSGTRRSENNPDNTSGARNGTSLAEALDDTPKISSQPFVLPGSQPVKKTPLIKDFIERTEVQPMPTCSAQIQQPTESEHTPEKPVEIHAAAVIETADEQPVAIASIQEAERITSPNTAPTDKLSDTASASATQQTPANPDSFETQWNQLFESLFSKTPMIYFPLKDHIPVFENNIIKIEVLNTFQQDQYQMHKRAMLEYWRTHFTDNVDDIEITLNEHLEVKKIIFTAEDKLKNLQEQNPKITDFMNILNFKIKN